MKINYFALQYMFLIFTVCGIMVLNASPTSNHQQSPQTPAGLKPADGHGQWGGLVVLANAARRVLGNKEILQEEFQKLISNHDEDAVGIYKTKKGKLKSDSDDKIFDLNRGMKKILILNFLRRLLKGALPSDQRGIPWAVIQKSGIKGWPENVPISTINSLRQDDLDNVLRNIENIEFTDDAIQKIRESFQNRIHTFLGYFTNSEYNMLQNHFLELFRTQLNHVMIWKNIPWTTFSNDDFIGWPSHVPVRNPILLTREEAKAVAQNLNELVLSDSFIQKSIIFFKNQKALKQNRRLINQYFESMILQCNSKSSRSFWKQLSHRDFVNWPLDIPIKHIEDFTVTEIDRMIPILNSIRFSDLFLNQKSCNSSNMSRLKKILKVSEEFKTKLESKGIHIGHIPWKKLSREDIIGWPPEVKFLNSPHFLSVKDLDLLISKFKEMDFTPEAIEKISNSKSINNI